MYFDSLLMIEILKACPLLCTSTSNCFYVLFLQLLKIERVSATGVKQTSISDVNFAPLVAMPDSDSSLPKLFFPKENPKRREKVC